MVVQSRDAETDAVLRVRALTGAVLVAAKQQTWLPAFPRIASRAQNARGLLLYAPFSKDTAVRFLDSAGNGELQPPLGERLTSLDHRKPQRFSGLGRGGRARSL